MDKNLIVIFWCEPGPNGRAAGSREKEMCGPYEGCSGAMLPTCYRGATKLGNEPKFCEMLSAITFPIELSQPFGFSYLFRGAENAEGKLDGVAGFEPADDRIKICCLAA